MTRSMTAFARREAHGDWGGQPARLTWELRAVNHRYLDIHPRLPEELRSLEPAVRERVAARVGRGRVECHLRYTPTQTTGALEVDWQRIEEIRSIAAAIREQLGDEVRPASTTEILRLPGVLREPETAVEPVQTAALELLETALDELSATRVAEGARLRSHIEKRAATAREIATRLVAARPEVNATIQRRLEARLEELPSPAETGRLEQELVYIAQRMDIDEELERLVAHLDELAERLHDEEEPVGRRLDFLMQELNREANTIASKASHGDTSRDALELKVLIEQMREQVQNVE